MRATASKFLIPALLGVGNASDTRLNNGSFNLQAFSINLSGELSHMLQQVKDMRLPQEEVPGYPGPAAGISIDTVQSFRNEWLDKFEWEKEQNSMNR